MAEEKVVLLDIRIDTEKLSKDRKAAVDEVIKINIELEKLAAERKGSQKELDAAILAGDESVINSLRRRIIENEGEAKAIQQSKREQIKVVQLAGELEKKAESGVLSSKADLRKARIIEQTQLDRLKGTIAENAKGQIVLTKAGEKAVGQLNKYNTGLIDFGKSVNDGKNNVGNYTSSMLEAVDKTGLFSGGLGNLKTAFAAVRSGAATVKDGVNLVKESFSASIVTQKEWATAGSDAADSATMTGTSSEAASKSIGKVGVTGVRSFGTLRSAIAATGLGLFLIALGLVFNYLKTIDPLVDKIEQLFAGFGQAIKEVGKGIFQFGKDIIEGLTNPLKLLETLNPINIVKRIAGIGEAAVKAGGDAMDLTAAMQDLEDVEREASATLTKNNIEAEKNRRLSEDRTKSARERLSFLQKAQAAELENLKVEEGLAKSRADNAAEAVRLAGGIINANDDVKKSYQDLANDLLKITSQIENKAAADRADAAKLNLKLQKDFLAGKLSLLNEELRFEELNNTASLDLKKRILLEQRNLALQESDLSGQQRQAIENKYKNDLLSLEKETNERLKVIRQQGEDAAIAATSDTYAREIAAEAVGLQRKLDTITGNSAEEGLLKIQLTEQSALKVLEIQKKENEKGEKERLDIILNNAVVLSSEQERIYGNDLDQLKVALSNRLITQDEFNKKANDLEVEYLRNKLDIQLESVALEQAEIVKSYLIEKAALDQKLAANRISEKQYNDQKTELDQEFYAAQGESEALAGANALALADQINALRLEGVLTTNEAILNDSQRLLEGRRAIADVEQQLLSRSIQGVVQLISSNEQGRKKFADFLKVLAIGEVIINLRREISSNNLQAAADPLRLVPGGEALVRAKQIAFNIKAGVEAGIGIATISAQKFAVGGHTAIEHSLIKHSSFAQGGNVNTPRLGLIGEQGSEWVSPNWMMNDPNTAPIISNLEHYRVNKVMPFAAGGFTLPPLPNSSGTTISASAFATAVRDAISDLTITPVVSVQEIIASTNQKVSVIDRATF